MLPSFAYVRVRSVSEAIDQLAAGSVHLHAGGTDLLGCLRDGVFRADRIVSLGGLGELRGLRETRDGGMRIGALTTITEVAESPTVRDRYPLLARAASEVASPQLRNQGTLGGNLCQKPRCWYYRGEFACLRKGGAQCFAVNGQNQFHCILGGNTCYIVHPSDTAPALVALDAKVEIAGPNGNRTLALADFHVPPSEDPQRETWLEPQEIVTAIVLPPPPRGLRSAYRKVRTRRSWDFALAGTALALELDGDTVTSARVILSGAAPFPWRSREAEQALAGQPLHRETVARAAAAAMEPARPLEQNGYKIALFQGLIEQELLSLV